MYKVDHEVYPTSFDANNCPVPEDSDYCLKFSNGNSLGLYTVDNGSSPSFSLTAVNGNMNYIVTNSTGPEFYAVPGAPTGLTATVDSSTQITLNWVAPADSGGSEITGYKVYRSTSPGSETLLTTLGDVLTYQNTGLSEGTTYYYKVTAINSSGSSIYSNEASGLAHNPQFTATGGNIVADNGGYRIHTFTSSGTFDVTIGGMVDVLVVAGGGGGGGGAGADSYNGGGGAGGVIYQTSFVVNTGSYSVTVGNGGASNTNGQNSVFSSLMAIGGGKGAGNAAAGNGGSGGGAAYQHHAYGTGTPGQGNNGGLDDQGGGAAGGGGAGAAGQNTTAVYGGNGGVGISNSITGSEVYYGGGGGSGGYNVVYTGGNGGGGNGGYYTGGASYYNGSNGAVNTGGGGGGAWNANNGGTGGSGIVIIRYVHS